MYYFVNLEVGSVHPAGEERVDAPTNSKGTIVVEIDDEVKKVDDWKEKVVALLRYKFFSSVDPDTILEDKNLVLAFADSFERANGNMIGFESLTGVPLDLVNKLRGGHTVDASVLRAASAKIKHYQ